MKSKKILAAAFVSGVVALGICEGSLTFAVDSAERASEMLEKLPKNMESIIPNYPEESKKLIIRGEIAQKAYFDAKKTDKIKAAERFYQEMVNIYHDVKYYQKLVAFKKIKDEAEYKETVRKEKADEGYLAKRLGIEEKQKINNLNAKDWAGISASLQKYDSDLEFSSRIEDVNQCHEDLESILKRYDELLLKQRNEECKNLKKAVEEFKGKYTKVIDELDTEYKITLNAKDRCANKRLAPVQSKYIDIIDDLRKVLDTVGSYEDMTLFENKVSVSKGDLAKIKSSEEEILIDINSTKNKNKLIELLNDPKKAVKALKDKRASFKVLASSNGPLKLSIFVYLKSANSYGSKKTNIRPSSGKLIYGRPGLGKTFTSMITALGFGSDFVNCKIAEYAEDPAGFLKFYRKCLADRTDKSKIGVFMCDDVDGVLKGGAAITKAVRQVIDEQVDLGQNLNTVFFFTANRGIFRNSDGIWEADPNVFAPEILRCLDVEEVDYPSRNETIKTLKVMFASFGVSDEVSVERVADALMVSGDLRTPAKINQLMNLAATFAREESLGLKSGKKLDDSVSTAASSFEGDVDFDNLSVSNSSVSTEDDLSNEDWRISSEHMKKALKKMGAGDLE